jgi:hypothetical protein
MEPRPPTNKGALMKTILRALLSRGKFTVLAVVTALTLATASVAVAGSGIGGVFNLGVTNTVNAITKLTGNVAGPSLQIINNSTNAAATALNLQVATGKTPMKVNSATKVANLNADRVDGKDGFLDDTTYEVFKSFTGTANAYDTDNISCDAEDRVLSGGYFLQSGVDSNVTLEEAAGNTYFFEVLSGPSAETGTIFALCADQDGDLAGTAAANVADSPQALLEEARAARK